MSMECNAIDLSYCEGEKVWKRVHKVEIFFDTEKERDEFEAALNAGNVKIARPARWEPSDSFRGYVHCTGCADCYLPASWVDDNKWKYCPECGAPMENGGQHG